MKPVNISPNGISSYSVAENLFLSNKSCDNYFRVIIATTQYKDMFMIIYSLAHSKWISTLPSKHKAVYAPVPKVCNLGRHHHGTDVTQKLRI